MRLVLLTLMIAVISMVVYDETQSESIKVKLDIRDNANAAEVISELGSRVTEVRAIDSAKNQYEVTIRTRKKQSLLSWLLGKEGVENAEIEKDD
jgi:hypothetical protein